MVKLILSLMMTVAVLSLVMPSVLTAQAKNHQNKANAASLQVFCGDSLGAGMTSVSDKQHWTFPLINSGLPAANSKRTLNGMEAFGQGVRFVSYQGETSPDDDKQDKFTTKDPRDNDPEKLLAKNNPDEEASLELIYGARSLSNCLGNDAALGAASFGLMTGRMITAAATSFTTFAFSNNIVCADPAPGFDACVDLLFITGGDGTSANKGLIGNLTDSIYMPLLILAAFMVAIWVFYTGLVQRKIRDALFGVIWCVFSVIVGLAFLLNPALLAKAPAVVSNTLSGCVIAAFGGDNCVGGSPSDPFASATGAGGASEKICSPNLAGIPAEETMGVIASSLSCSIWKAFILEPFSQASFGSNFTDLDTKVAGSSGRKMVNKAGLNPNEFCVSMKPVNKIKDMESSTLLTGGGSQICNVALYQLYLSTNANTTPNPVELMDSGTMKVDAGWYKLVDVASTSDTLWGSWAGGLSSAVGKIMVGALMFLTSLMGGVVLIVIAVFAILYYVSAIFLMAFAPLFFLIGVHPGKGRDILKGYGEMVLSNVFKYVASALFLIVALAIYGGVLGASTHPGITLIMIFILSLALFMYRRELVDAIGTVNMGGQKLGSATTDRIRNFGSDKLKDTKRLAAITTGSAVGGLVVGGAKGFSAGATEGAMRELKRDGGLFGRVGAGAARGAEVAGKANRERLADNAKEATQSAAELGSEVVTATGTAKTANEQLDALTAQINELTKNIAASGAVAKESDPQKVLGDWKMSGDADKARYSKIHDARSVIATQERKLALASPDDPRRAAWAQQINERKAKIDGFAADLVNSGKMKELDEEFKVATAPHAEAVNAHNTAISQRTELMVKLPEAQRTADAADAYLSDVTAKRDSSKGYADSLTNEVDSYRKSALLRTKHVNEIEAAGQQGAGEAYVQSKDRSNQAFTDRRIEQEVRLTDEQNLQARPVPGQLGEIYGKPEVSPITPPALEDVVPPRTEAPRPPVGNDPAPVAPVAPPVTPPAVDATPPVAPPVASAPTPEASPAPAAPVAPAPPAPAEAPKPTKEADRPKSGIPTQPAEAKPKAEATKPDKAPEADKKKEKEKPEKVNPVAGANIKPATPPAAPGKGGLPVDNEGPAPFDEDN